MIIIKEWKGKKNTHAQKRIKYLLMLVKLYTS